MGGMVGINTRRALALVVVFAMAVSLVALYAVPAQSQVQTGFIQIKKLAPDDPTVSFAFSGSGGSGEIGNFSLKHNQTSTAFEVPLNTPYRITETAPADNHWYLENINCDDTGGDADVVLGTDPKSGSVTITVTQPGLVFTCNFDNEFSTNALNTGRLIVEKKASDVPTKEFTFTVRGEFDPGTVSTETFTINDLSGGGEKIDIRVPKDTPFVVTELDPDDLWYLQNITCDASGGAATSPVIHPKEEHKGGSVTMTVTGQQFECNFDNELDGHVGGTTTTTAPTGTTTTTTTPSGGGSGSFIDDDNSIFEADIEWLANEGVTKGCNPPTNNRFCPKQVVTRETMAAFLVRFLGLTADNHPGFSDVSGSNIFKADIEKLATAGITKGCNPPANTMFCPKAAVTRETMAAFLVRALGLTADNHPGFTDVSSSNIFRADIEKLATAGVTKGCNPPANTEFCPKALVTRETMAAFLHRAGPLR